MSNEEPAFGEGYDELDDWYDKALKNGFGFKSEKEKQDYIASIGDPMKHPLFAQTTEDLEGNPLAEAFRSLREEDKTQVELAEMYKEEGNQWIKKGTKKDYFEAYARYTHALTFMDKADQARTDKTESAADSKVDLHKVRSQILSNRALASSSVANYGKCYKDCDKAIALWPGNIKAHYRKCKALLALKKYSECIAACSAGLAVESGNKDFVQFRKQCESDMQSKSQAKADSQLRTLTELTQKWDTVYEISSTVGVTLGYPLYALPEPREMRDLWVHVDSETDTVRWPVLLQYPQYGTYDVLSAAGVDDMLVEHLAMAFPEKRDGPKLDWDVGDEYHVSNLAVYIQLHASLPIESREQWREACMEQRVLLQGGNIELLHLLKQQHRVGAAAAETPAALNFEKLKHSVELREKVYWERMTDVATGKLTTQSGQGLKTSSVQFVEVHLGCTIGAIVKAHFPAHVLARGVLTLLIYPRDNRLHKLFVEQNKAKIAHLLPR
jgi:tetratricopeptide (TPR) repeat protein